jgi:hypothetical protein
MLKDEAPSIGDEFESFSEAKVEEKLITKPPSHSLELNLILVFIYMASNSYGILEKDVLLAAQSNTIGYLTEYRKHLGLHKANYLLRPINVPFKNKWLRDTATDLFKHDGLPIFESSIHQIIKKASKNLAIPERISRLVTKIADKVFQKNYQSTFQ